MSVIICGVSLPVFAGERYPTNAEIRRLRQEFHQKTIPATRKAMRDGFIRDDRTASDLENRASFIKAWSRANPSIAPFLGEWGAQEEWLLIFPSNVRGRACVISIPGDEPNVVAFGLGSVSNKQFRVNFGDESYNVFIQEQDFLGDIQVHQNKAVVWPHWLPKPLKELSNSFYGRDTSRIIPQFQAAGCTASLPER